jgi:anthranilate phosphoribosyltransferase
MNASAALVSGFKAKGFSEGVKLAAQSIDSGRALDKLLKLIEMSNK